MSWGVSKSIEELLQRLRSNDPSLTSLHIFQGKKFGNEVNIDILEDFTTQGLPPANLKFENLLCHSLCDKEALNLAKALKDNTHLTELYASGHDLSTAAIRAISDAVGESPSIQVVCLGNSTLGDDGTTALAEGIAHSRSLQQLDLECKAVGAAGAASLGKALQGGLSITTLLLARNPLGNSGVEEISKGLLSSKLAHLDLRDCGLTASSIHSLADVVTSSRTLKVLRLDENALEADGAAALARALNSDCSLEDLHISHTSIGDEGLGAIAKASVGSNLRHLEASSCGITAKGAALLQEALDGGSPLVSLKLQGNSISDEGAASLGAALTKGAALQELNISNNQLGPGAARLLQGSSQIKKLDLSNASLGDEGAQQLSASLTACVHTNLQELELSGCGIGKPGVSRIFQVLQGFAAPALEVLLLAGNPGVSHPDFAMEMDILSTTRTDLDVVWRGNCDEPPTAVDGGPPKVVNTQTWADEPDGQDP